MKTKTYFAKISHKILMIKLIEFGEWFNENGTIKHQTLQHFSYTDAPPKFFQTMTKLEHHKRTETMGNDNGEIHAYAPHAHTPLVP